MADIFSYIKKVGKFSFTEQAFTDVDNAIFACLSYVDFSKIIDNTPGFSVSIEEAGNLFFKNYRKRDLRDNVFSVQTGIKIFAAIYQEKRYKDLKLRKYVYKGDEVKQFSALCINITKKLTYVSFEGTDELLSGWIEDASMSYKYPVPSQKEAIRYINRVINPFSHRTYILGGHSKGGNLALVAAMHANHLIKPKIKAIYMNDAPGLRLEQINTRQYRSIEKKVNRIITNYSIVGLFFNYTGEFKVILSSKKGVMAHNVSNWQVKDTEFYPSSLSRFSKNFQIKVKEWLETYNYQEREEFVSDLNEVFKRANITSVLDLKKNTLRKVSTVLKESKKINPKSKIVISNLIKFIVSFVKEESTTYLSEKIPKFKH